MDSGEKEAIQNLLKKMFRFAKFLNKSNVPLLWELGHYLIDNLILKICMFVAIDKNEEYNIFTSSSKNRTKDFPVLYKDILVNHYFTVPDYDQEVKRHHTRRNIFQHSETSLRESMRQEFVEPYLKIAEKIMKIIGIITDNTEISALNLFGKISIKTQNYTKERDLKIDEFKQERYSLIAQNKIPIEDKTRTVLHLIPHNAFKTVDSFDLSKINKRAYLDPIDCLRGRYTDYNADGLICLCGITKDNIESYTQVYRNGIIETVSSTLIIPGRHHITGKDVPAFNIGRFERDMIKSVIRYTQAQEQLGVKLPIYISIKLFDVKGYFILNERYEPSNPIDRDELDLGEILLERYDEKISTIMKPLFDRLWNALGKMSSSNYTENGEYMYELDL